MGTVPGTTLWTGDAGRSRQTVLLPERDGRGAAAGPAQASRAARHGGKTSRRKLRTIDPDGCAEIHTQTHLRELGKAKRETVEEAEAGCLPRTERRPVLAGPAEARAQRAAGRRPARNPTLRKNGLGTKLKWALPFALCRLQRRNGHGLPSRKKCPGRRRRDAGKSESRAEGGF